MSFRLKSEKRLLAICIANDIKNWIATASLKPRNDGPGKPSLMGIRTLCINFMSL